METVQEFVVLVDEQDRQIGIQAKQDVHSHNTPLHRAFSLFLFNPENRLLLQQRARIKKTWPLVWSNSCCGHPEPGESYEHAVIRRARFELGINVQKLHKISDYRYCFSKNGIVENEICPIFSGYYDGDVQPNQEEVESVKWIDWEAWVDETRRFPHRYSPWCIEETGIMASMDSFWSLGKIKQIGENPHRSRQCQRMLGAFYFL
ncbi:isopentenyl-diphosphate Delta-isomerase [Desulfobacula toluolica]|uniref:Isopentenyl-diphosphate delta-isomerase n=1 Tax=Desulfobacula toluolica (strain DSM 7467 / Tol2) TaxID=651182 RepID=K0NLH8_DESTT|nr:isopentenyl-diphosphate Delta-isomerase [Desulfobacula toluolica]CCK80861.1 Idi2: isopentenyl-diphosphate delta-isomerase [Desulfobacula toluolica Tol2]CCK80878.1 Idi3: isopentenyl-diphosphate delta-isomerase [Desulfobacula toluolica Tol2]CCK80899.1 Idi4: isopentenyl-diphosphate delta-isomerase [Desulfobacula toluolica Tol2]CCK80918.1 Idi5: isopentenyl-diphosphate delta-isomerase [Desulfobacula toluolica Tol2]CCK80939.1 Idi6: isopentenyl-diphosphate delta-isomerase [Desulfobacula toluolica 